MISFPKMKNLYKFDEETKGRKDEFTCPEFEYLFENEWLCTEKIDGTNIRLIFNENSEMEIRGRTDKANLHPILVENIRAQLKDVHLTNVTLYGEGCGEGIQKGSMYGEKHFVAFDVYDNAKEYFWDRRDSMKLFNQLDIENTLKSGHIITLMEAHWRVHNGLMSAYDPNILAEGLVCTPWVPVRDICGNRIIVKVKTRDYYKKELV